MTMASIPPSSDLWVEIWKRLPTKSICRFRCVCKPWNSLLSSSFFIALQYKFTVSNTPANEKAYLLMTGYDDELEQCVVYQPEEKQRGGDVRERAIFYDLPYSTDPALKKSEYECICFSIVGVIHGVVCLTSDLNMIVWNPTIHKHISLFIGKADYGFTGFGFDAAKNDFKVVVVAKEFYEVYSVQDGLSRRKLLPTDGIKHRPKESGGCFVNGNIYWLVPSTADKTVYYSGLLMFDCEREEFKTMELPRELGNVKGRLFKHGGMLSVTTLPRYESQCLELWVMEDEYCTGTWRKVLNRPAKSYSIMFGKNRYKYMSPMHRIELSSDDLPMRLPMFDQQPLSSEPFHKSLFLMNVNTNPLHKRLLTCHDCLSPFAFVGSFKTLFQSRLL